MLCPKAAVGATALLLLGACAAETSKPAGSSGAEAAVPAGANLFDIPLAGITRDQDHDFNTGDNLFDLPLRPYDGLGPLYTRPSCGACHDAGVRGPGLVQKMAIVEADGVTPAADQSKLEYGHTLHPLLADGDGATTPIVPPADDPSVKVSIRVGPPVLGRGYMEAVLDSEIERMESEQAERSDAIHGRINHVVYASEDNPDTSVHMHHKGDELIGRFGLKARIASIDDFTADAMQGDMGITSPLRPTEFPNPDGLTDDLKPGIDASIDDVNARATYLRLLAIPWRPSDDTRGEKLFAQVKCNVCHAPVLATRKDYPIEQLAGVKAAAFTDLLLHDMGDQLADGIVDGEAGGRDWRTAPLIGLRFNKSFMHDGRARSIEEALHAHTGDGSEANDAIVAYDALTSAERKTLLDYVSAL